MLSQAFLIYQDTPTVCVLYYCDNSVALFGAYSLHYG